MAWSNRLYILLTLLCSITGLQAQNPITDNVSIERAENIVSTTTGDTLRPTRYIPIASTQHKPMFFQGFTLSADLFGPAMYLLSDYGNAEAALRLNLRNTYFPVFEAGYGKCKTTDETTNISYATSAPYFRIGMDYNILRDKFQENQFFVGARYGFSSFNFDMSGPNMSDPIWGGTAPFNYTDSHSTSSWLEVIIGVQVKIWHHFHMGWSVRYKQQLKIGQPDYAKPYYVPGYGITTNTSCWGGTYNLIFDLNWGKKKK